MKKIKIPTGAKILEFTIDESEYELSLHEITHQILQDSESFALIEMQRITGATHQGSINFKNGAKGSNVELNKELEAWQYLNEGMALRCFMS